MPKVKFVNEKKTIEIQPGANLQDAARQNGIQVSSRVLIKNAEGNVNEPDSSEKFILTAGPLTFLRRMSNQEDLRVTKKVSVQGDIEVITNPAINWHGEKFWA